MNLKLPADLGDLEVQTINKINNIMKIDLKKLQKVEKQYEESRLSTDTLHLMINNVLNFQDTSYSLAPNNVKTAINTLTDLKILISDGIDTPPVQQLNS
jgi:O-phosphoseryl-tRNA(Cys) synthetase